MVPGPKFNEMVALLDRSLNAVGFTKSKVEKHFVSISRFIEMNCAMCNILPDEPYPAEETISCRIGPDPRWVVPKEKKSQFLVTIQWLGMEGFERATLCGPLSTDTTVNIFKRMPACRHILFGGQNSSFEFLQPVTVGLHATENFFWSLPNSDLYSANSYDLLYSDESGKWGKHLCLLLLEVLKANEYKGWLTAAE
ncbi:hypothetical protein B0H17DRAFT_1146354 [Mycena rosella]|uniref:Uncharacterized protein n=1 Tax=Mycena rosella TaxID=1033263 RepID=A0AAD7G4M2_MYCRO|nr:hypothetical protein B0H17DRAFT_1146354 [Mycena rosella]